VHHISTKKTK